MQLQIDPRLRGLSRRLPAWSIYSVISVLLGILLIAQVARMGWALVTPPGRFGDWQPAPAIGRDSARGELQGFDPFFRLDAAAAPTSGVVTNLQLTLFGTRVDEAMGRGSAIIATPDGVQKSYAPGEEIMPGVTLKQVAFDHVTIDRGGATEDLFIDQSGGGALPAETELPPSLSRPASLVDGAVQSQGAGVGIAEIRAGIGFIPRIDGGRVTGLAVRPQGGSGIFQRLGFRPGDVITRLNGTPVTSADDLSMIAGGMANGGSLSVSVERGAEVLPLVINVKGK